jgi:hypothetical protein
MSEPFLVFSAAALLGRITVPPAAEGESPGGAGG